MLDPDECDRLYAEPWIPLQHLAQAVVDVALDNVEAIKPLLALVESLLAEDTDDMRKFVGFGFVDSLASAADVQHLVATVAPLLGPLGQRWWPPTIPKD
jgi:hypothetical protein